jgi:chaperone required for assembly of F1-ATPase
LQAERWDPLVSWIASRFDVALRLGAGVTPQPQPPETIAQIAKAVDARSDWELAALHSMTSISGSVVVALALLEGRIGLEEAWRAGQVDELFQLDKWGSDPLALQALEARERDLKAAHRFALLLRAA